MTCATHICRGSLWESLQGILAGYGPHRCLLSCSLWSDSCGWLCLCCSHSGQRLGSPEQGGKMSVPSVGCQMTHASYTTPCMPPPGCNLSQVRGPAQQLQQAIDSFLCRVLWYFAEASLKTYRPGGGTSTGLSDVRNSTASGHMEWIWYREIMLLSLHQLELREKPC